MTSSSSRNPLQDFILTPQQQSLLFAALNSNRAANSPRNNGLTLSPSSFTQSPTINEDPHLVQESPYLDNDYSFEGADTSFDSLFDNTVDGLKMIGDLPGSASKPESITAVSDGTESPEKRSHPDDDDDESAENGAKRRESTDKVPKKPGRKPLTSEPTSKRKAQNRAAQRAFRERKEKHVKDLEAKVQELEEASQAANSENSNLRAEVERLSVELKEYKKRLTLVANPRPQSAPKRNTYGNPMLNNISDVNFQFEFPKFGSLPGPPVDTANGSSAATARSSSLSQSPSAANTPSNQGSPNDGSNSNMTPSSLDGQTKDDLAKFSGIFNPPLTNSNVANVSRGSVDSHYSAGGASTSSPSASSASHMGGHNSSCGTSPEPFTQSPMGFKPVDTLTTIGEEHTAASGGNQDLGQFSSINMNDIDWLAQASNFQFDPQLFGDYREPQENVFNSGSGVGDNFFNDAWDVDFTTPFNMPASPVVPKKDLISQIDAAKEADDLDNRGELLTCNKIWEQLQNCPKVQNGDFDLDGLCSELQKKAKCSGHGAVVDQKDFQTVMQKYLGKEGDLSGCSLSLGGESAKAEQLPTSTTPR